MDFADYAEGDSQNRGLHGLWGKSFLLRWLSLYTETTVLEPESRVLTTFED